MQSQLVDSKLSTLFQNYGDQDFVKSASKEVEEIRRSADNLGLIVTLSAFGLNEVARLTLRSRKRKLSNSIVQRCSSSERKTQYSGSRLQLFFHATAITSPFTIVLTICGAFTRIEKAKVQDQLQINQVFRSTTSRTSTSKSTTASMFAWTLSLTELCLVLSQIHLLLAFTNRQKTTRTSTMTSMITLCTKQILLSV